MQQIYQESQLGNNNLKQIASAVELAKNKELKEIERRIKIIDFYNKNGGKLTREAFNVASNTIGIWKRRLKEAEGDLNSLAPYNKSPKNKRQKYRPEQILNFILNYRKNHPKVGANVIKPHLDKFCKTEKIKTISRVTIERIILELKKKNKIIEGKKGLRQSVRTGKILQVKPRCENTTKTRKPKDEKIKQAGQIVQIDTVHLFLDGIKKYIFTAIDLHTRISFAFTYERITSKNAKDFMRQVQQIMPFKINKIQTDNGSEFMDEFYKHIKDEKIIHYHNYPRSPKSNAFIERFNRTLREQFINCKEDFFHDTIEFNNELMKYLIWYNTQRRHYSLNNTPIDFFIKNFLPKNINMFRGYTKT